MERSAQVTSIDAIREFRGALLTFGSDAQDSLVMATLEARKAIQWLQQDRARYWPDQVRRAQEKVIQARNELDRCQLQYGSEQAPSCFDQKKRLERAKQRLSYCEEKVKVVKRWVQTVRQELDDFDGELAKMTGWLEVDLPRAAASLERMLRALDKYAADYGNVDRGSVAAPETRAADATTSAPLVPPDPDASS